MLSDYYAILGVAPEASPEQVRAAYRRLAKQYHPDAGGDPERFRVVQEAYARLSDPAQRQKHLYSPTAAEPLIPSRPRQPEPFVASRASPFRRPEALEDLDRLFREFDEFFERLEADFGGPCWGRNE
ncbi:MAG: DnaJ domain-containing protein [Acidobacteria bacterium]|nr:DnaJ domain-containing protein [Acidobacteriota bacterium]